MVFVNAAHRVWNWYVNHLKFSLPAATILGLSWVIFNSLKPTPPVPLGTHHVIIQTIFQAISFLIVLSGVFYLIRLTSPTFGYTSTVINSIKDSLKKQCALLEDITLHKWHCMLQFPHGICPRILITRYSSWEAKTKIAKQIQSAHFQEFELPPGLAWHGNLIHFANLTDNGPTDKWIVSKRMKRKVPGITNMISIPITKNIGHSSRYDNCKVDCVATFINSENYNVVKDINAELLQPEKESSRLLHTLTSFIGLDILTVLVQQELLPKLDRRR